jgi:hypothetical protein
MCFEETDQMHTFFAGIAFNAILTFMIYHIPHSKSILHQFSFNMPPLGAEMNELERLLCASSMRKGLLLFSLILQFGLYSYILFHVFCKEPVIFWSEVLYIANFAAYYLLLHANI